MVGFPSHSTLCKLYNSNSKLKQHKNCKGKVASVHTMCIYMGSRGTAPLIDNLGISEGEW